MKTKSILCCVSLAFACLAQVGCALSSDGDTEEGREQKALGTGDENASVNAATGTWIVVGGESCGDICGIESCGCLPGCPGKPRQGEACTPFPRSCYSYGRNGGSATEFFCRPN